MLVIRNCIVVFCRGFCSSWRNFYSLCVQISWLLDLCYPYPTAGWGYISTLRCILQSQRNQCINIEQLRSIDTLSKTQLPTRCLFAVVCVILFLDFFAQGHEGKHCYCESSFRRYDTSMVSVLSRSNPTAMQAIQTYTIGFSLFPFIF